MPEKRRKKASKSGKAAKTEEKRHCASVVYNMLGCVAVS